MPCLRYRRRLRLLLVIVSTVLLLLHFPSATEAHPAIVPVPAQMVPPATTVPEPIELTVSAVGDCVIGTDYRFRYDTSFNHKAESVDAAYFFSGVQDLLAQDDLTVANLESTLTAFNERAYKAFQESPFWFRGPAEFTAILRAGSVEALNLANNHSHDYGVAGHDETRRNLEKAGITSFGYESTADLNIKGVRVALLGFNELGINERGADPVAFADRVLATVRAARTDHDLVIVSLHWGQERATVPSAAQVELAHRIVDAGADLVLGHHPHVLQGIETYKGRHIVYSLGNFVYGGSRGLYDGGETMVYQETFGITAGDVISRDYQVTPAVWSSHTGYNDYKPRIATGKTRDVIERELTERTVLVSELVAGRPEADVGNVARLRNRMYAGGRSYELPEIVTDKQLDAATAASLVDFRELAPEVVYQPVYAMTQNVLGRPLYYRDYPYLRVGTARKLAEAQALASEYGYRIKVWDAYRPPEAQWMLWEHTPDARYVASPLRGYSAHNRGTTVDVTLVDREGMNLAMPSGFDDFSARADRNYGDVASEQAENAKLLERIMKQAGFVGYQGEWWHYSDTERANYGVVDLNRVLASVQFADEGQTP